MSSSDHAHAESDSAPVLPREPGIVEVVGELHEVVFPPLCVSCGAETRATLPLTRLFWRDDDGGPGHVAALVHAPFCPSCIEVHRREVPPLDPEVRKRLLRKWAVASLPYVFPLGVIAWLLTVLVPNVFRADEPLEALVWAAPVALFAGFGWMFFRLIRNQGRALVAGPGGGYVHVYPGPLGSRFLVPAEPTSVTRALDFSDDESEMFDAERHRFTFQNNAVASSFAELNAARQWKPGGPRARVAHHARRAIVAVVVLVVVYQLAKELFF